MEGIIWLAKNGKINRTHLSTGTTNKKTWIEIKPPTEGYKDDSSYVVTVRKYAKKSDIQKISESKNLADYIREVYEMASISIGDITKECGDNELGTWFQLEKSGQTLKCIKVPNVTVKFYNNSGYEIRSNGSSYGYQPAKIGVLFDGKVSYISKNGFGRIDPQSVLEHILEVRRIHTCEPDLETGEQDCSYEINLVGASNTYCKTYYRDFFKDGDDWVTHGVSSGNCGIGLDDIQVGTCFSESTAPVCKDTDKGKSFIMIDPPDRPDINARTSAWPFAGTYKVELKNHVSEEDAPFAFSADNLETEIIEDEDGEVIDEIIGYLDTIDTNEHFEVVCRDTRKTDVTYIIDGIKVTEEDVDTRECIDRR